MLELFQKGFIKWSEPAMANYINTDDMIMNFEHSNEGVIDISNEPFIQAALETIHQEIALKYVEPYARDYRISKHELRGNPKEHSRYCDWHVDAGEKSNLFFLLYFNDLTVVDQGALIFKNGDREWRNVPNYGDLIALNNATKTDFIHRVEYTTHRRVTAEFDFFVNWNFEKILRDS